MRLLPVGQSADAPARSALSIPDGSASTPLPDYWKRPSHTRIRRDPAISKLQPCRPALITAIDARLSKALPALVFSHNPLQIRAPPIQPPIFAYPSPTRVYHLLHIRARLSDGHPPLQRRDSERAPFETLCQGTGRHDRAAQSRSSDAPEQH
jgi:hypothetical protein